MADTAIPWAILTATAARLEEIYTDTGYRTDIGANVSTEPKRFDPEEGTLVTLYAGPNTYPDDARSKGEREFEVLIEVLVPAAWGNAQRVVVDAAEDIEQALDAYLQQPMALPLRFVESMFLPRPEGLPAMCAQLMFSTRFRR